MAPFSPWVLAVLVAVLAASWVMLSYLMRSWTQGRRRARLLAWGRARGLTASGSLPAPIAPHLAPLGTTRVLMTLERPDDAGRPDRFITRLRAERTPASRAAARPSTWIFAGQRLRASPGPTLAALRPATTTTSLVDILAAAESPIVWSYPSVDLPGELPGSDAFTIFAGSPADALALARSRLPGALPHDVGLLIADGWLILDLSARPFDELSLATGLQLLDQLSSPPTTPAATSASPGGRTA